MNDRGYKKKADDTHRAPQQSPATPSTTLHDPEGTSFPPSPSNELWKYRITSGSWPYSVFVAVKINS